MRFNTFFSLPGGLVLFAFCAASCQPTADNAGGDSTKGNQLTVAPAVLGADTAAHGDTPDSTDDYAICYIMVADTGKNYYKLRKVMAGLHDKSGWPIDTMNRHYDPEKDNIVVADNDDDEMYRGEYFPRRFPSAYLSLEYYTTYTNESSKKNIALVAGIYDAKKSADSALSLIRPLAARAFVAKARVFVGCMH